MQTFEHVRLNKAWPWETGYADYLGPIPTLFVSGDCKFESFWASGILTN